MTTQLSETMRSLHDDIVAELSSFAQRLRPLTSVDSEARIFLDGIMRDAYLLERSAERNLDQEDSEWMEPFLAVISDKLQLAPRILTEHADVVSSYSHRMSALFNRNEIMRLLRSRFRPLLQKGLFHQRVQERYNLSALEALLDSPRYLSRTSDEIPPEWRLAARTLECLGLQRAVERADYFNSEHKEDIDKLIGELEAILSNNLTRIDSPGIGQTPAQAMLSVRGKRRDFNIPEGRIAQTFATAFGRDDKTLNHAVVLLSAGLELRIIPTIETIIEQLPAQRRLDVSIALRPAIARLGQLLENEDSTIKTKAKASLDCVSLLMPAVDNSDQQSELISVLQSDFADDDAQWILASPSAVMDEGCQWESRDVFSYDYPPGQVVRLIRPGLSLAGELLCPALVQVSQGEPPANDLDELFELLPDDDDRALHLKERLKRARLLSAGDAGAQLARELADLSLFLRDDYLTDAARLAIRMVIDAPPADLLTAPGWESLNDFLIEQLDYLFEDGENGENAIYRLTRPYLQGLRTHDFKGVVLRSLGESLSPLLSLYDETLSAAAREWLYGELERLPAVAVKAGGHVRRLLRVASKALSQFHNDSDERATIELLSALKRSGIQVFPDSAGTLDHCLDPAFCFHVFEARYDMKPRKTILSGEYQPSLTLAKNISELSADNTETGAVTLSLGPKSELLNWLESAAVRESRVSSACDAMIRELTRLDTERLIAELAGRANAEVTFVQGLATILTSSLTESEWCRSAQDRDVFGPLFKMTRELYHLTLYPGYWTYREMRALVKEFGSAQIQIKLSREGEARMEIHSHGVHYRDRFLTPLNIHWTVGEAPPYVSWLREQFPWFDSVLDGSDLNFEIGSSAKESILDFQSPDASGLDAVVRSLETILDWLSSSQTQWLDPFCDALKRAPELELDVFPRAQQRYTRKELLSIIERSNNEGSIEIVKDPGRDDGEPVLITRRAFYRDTKLLSAAPIGRFAFKALPLNQLSLADALQPILNSENVLPTVKGKLQLVLTKMALTDESLHTAMHLEAFKILWDAHLVDRNFLTESEQPLYRAAIYLTKMLRSASMIEIERFEAMETLETVHSKYSPDQVSVEDVFTLPGKSEIVNVRQPLVFLEGRAIQNGSVLRGVSTSDETLLEYDRVLSNAMYRLRTWQLGAKAVIDAIFDEKQQQIMGRTLKRIEDTRSRMFKLARDGKKALPAKTSRRDVIRFLVDQIHRLDDALAIQPDKSHRMPFSEQVFKDVVYRSAGPYLSKEYGINIDMSVVAGADSQALVGQYKKESIGPKPVREHRRIYSVVVPCYKQDGVTIRPATVRLGDY
jgi:hypothetical protein